MSRPSRIRSWRRSTLRADIARLRIADGFVDPEARCACFRLSRSPGKPGTSLIDADGSTWPTQVIVLTAYDGGMSTRSANSVGAFTYLIKGSPLSVISGAILRASAMKRALEARARSRSTGDIG